MDFIEIAKFLACIIGFASVISTIAVFYMIYFSEPFPYDDKEDW